MTLDSHRINLLPVAIKAQREGRNFLYLMFAGAAGVFVLLGFLWFQKGQQVSSAKAATDAQRAANTKVQREITNLDYIDVKNNAVSAKETLVKSSWTGEVSWYRVLQDVATTMPSQTWLTTFQATASSSAAAAPAKAAAPAAPGAVEVAGQFTIQGKGFDHPDSADWLARISQMREVVNLWLPSSTASGGDNGTQRSVDFSSSGSLTSDAWSTRAKHAASGDLYEGTSAQ